MWPFRSEISIVPISSHLTASTASQHLLRRSPFTPSRTLPVSSLPLSPLPHYFPATPPPNLGFRLDGQRFGGNGAAVGHAVISIVNAAGHLAAPPPSTSRRSPWSAAKAAASPTSLGPSSTVTPSLAPPASAPTAPSCSNLSTPRCTPARQTTSGGSSSVARVVQRFGVRSRFGIQDDAIAAVLLIAYEDFISDMTFVFDSMQLLGTRIMELIKALYYRPKLHNYR